ncbi:hypothetical protein DPMN_064564 [Dreissena polymorpha]|uniref:Uncharacterized protein n=1 Tax=Dreissena polymorpha TaxID=45954 RepID=A0A9D4CCG1_DREPO|nr:hypothetical protein DPMN_064564 [Dreissena polymorpha]
MASLCVTSHRPERQNGFPNTLSVLSTAVQGHFLVHISAQGLPRPSYTLPPRLLPSLFRRCSKTTIHLRTITIPLGDPSNLWESAKTAGEEVRFEG